MQYLILLVSAVSAIATVSIAIIAKRQLTDLKQGQKKWATLQVCDKYDTDPVLREIVSGLKKHESSISNTNQISASANNKYDPREDSIVLLNYFDAIAIGIEQEFYVKKIVGDHLYSIIDEWIKTLKSWDELKFTDTKFRKEHHHLYKYVEGERSHRNKVRARNK